MSRSRYESRVELWLRGQDWRPTFVCEHLPARHVGRRWRLDFAWPELKVGVEIDGGGRKAMLQRNPRTGQLQPVAVGRHGTATDYEKLNWLAENGWRVLRFNPDMLRNPSAVLATIKRTLEAALAQRPAGSILMRGGLPPA